MALELSDDEQWCAAALHPLFLMVKGLGLRESWAATLAGSITTLEVRLGGLPEDIRAGATEAQGNAEDGVAELHARIAVRLRAFEDVARMHSLDPDATLADFLPDAFIESVRGIAESSALDPADLDRDRSRLRRRWAEMHR